MAGPACPVCDKGSRAQCYCRRSDCGLRPSSAALGSGEPDHARYNELLGGMRHWPDYIGQFAEAAYSIAQTETAGPKASLLRIAETASDFAAAIERTKPL